MTRVAAIVGPTAAGKSDVALQIAPALDAEIVSIDSMQAYVGMDIGTAKPTRSDRRVVPHHMIDVFDPSRDVSVAEFRDRARAAIQDVSDRGRLPLLVGGSGLYFRAVVDDLDFPPRAPEIRERLEAEAEDIGARALHERLASLDPVAAGRIEPGNARRTIRALEVIELTGRPFSEADAWDRYESIYGLDVVGVSLDREVLYPKIAARVDRMLTAGLVEEVARLQRAGMGRTAQQALGYRQIIEMPDAGPQAVRDEIVRATKRFARRQESWFRSDPRVHWIDGAAEDVAETALSALAVSSEPM